MPNKLEYKSTIKSKPFLYKEMKKAAELINQGFKDFEIKDMSRNDNIFQVNTEARKSEIASIVIQRLKAIDDFLVEKIVNGEIGTSKQIVVYSIMKTDRLFLNSCMRFSERRYLWVILHCKTRILIYSSAEKKSKVKK